MGDLHSVVSPKAAWGIVALTPVEVLEVPHPELMSIAMKHPTVGMAFWRDGTADASILAKWAANARRSARSRLAHLMCEIGLRSEMAKLGTRTAFHFPVSQHQLADIVGLTAVHVNRTLQALRSDGLIRSHQGTVFVDDLEGLRKVADFDESYLLLGLA
jgi:CRP-like cAMP-binding protein